MPTEEFERVRLDVSGRGVTVTSWYDTLHQCWRANAPAHGHLLNDLVDNPVTGSTREKAIVAVRGRLAERFVTENQRFRR